MESVKNVPREVGMIEDLQLRYKLRGVAKEKGMHEKEKKVLVAPKKSIKMAARELGKGIKEGSERS